MAKKTEQPKTDPKPRKKRPSTGRPEGRPPIFSDPKVFEEMIQKYWRTITRDVEWKQPLCVMQGMPDSKFKSLDEEEKARLSELVPVLNNDGQPIIRTQWIKPPMLLELQLYMGLSKQDWSNYGLRPEYFDSVNRARQVTESYLASESAAREGNTNGLKFLLSACYGYREVQGLKVEMAEKLEDDFA